MYKLLPYEIQWYIFDFIDGIELLNLYRYKNENYWKYKLKNIMVSDIYDKFNNSKYKYMYIYYQLYIFDYIKKVVDGKYNIFLYGPGGTGKSYIINKLNEYYKKCIILSMTGISSIDIGGQTVHRYFGFKPNYNVKKIISKCNLTNNEIFIIDEISMMSSDMLEDIDYLLKLSSNNTSIFGNNQIILSGDVLQMKPIHGDWFFKSKVYKNADFKIIKLFVPNRFVDENYWEMLLNIRKGKISTNQYNLLHSRLNININCNIKPTILLSKNKDVDFINNKEFNKLITYSSTYCAKKSIYLYKNNQLIDAKEESYPDFDIILKIDTKVMLTTNKFIDDKICNGSIGIIMNINKNSVVIKFNNNVIKTIPYITIITKEYLNTEIYRKVEISYIPLRLAWAITIHKSQGATLDSALIDAGSSIFTDNLAYVAFSRVSKLSNLYLINLHRQSITCDKEALNFNKKIINKWNKIPLF